MIRDYVRSIRRFSPNARRYLAGAFFFGFGSGTLWVLLNLHLRELGYSEAWIGRILSAQAFGTVLAAIVVATTASRRPLRPFLLAAAALYGGAIVLLATGRELSVLFPAAAAAGAGFTVHHVLAAPFFMRNSGTEERLHLFGMSWAVEILASVLATALSGWAARVLTGELGSLSAAYRATLVGTAAVSFLAVVPYWRITAMPPAREETPGFVRPRYSGLLARLIVPAFLVGSGAGLIVPFLNLYFRDRFAQSPDDIGRIFAVGQILTALGFLAGPAVARRIGMIRTVVAAELASIPFFLLLAFTARLPVAVTAFWFRGALMNMNHPVSSNFAMEAVGEDRQALTNSALMLAWNLSWMLSTQLGGVLIHRYGFTPPMVAAAVLYSISSLLYFTFFDRFERGRRAPLPAGVAVLSEETRP